MLFRSSSIYGDAAEEAIKKGGTLDDVDKTRVLGYGLLSGGVELAGDMFALGTTHFGGMKLARGTENLLSSGSMPARMAKKGLATGLAEGSTEAAQYKLESMGSGKPTTREGYIDNFMGGFGGGSVIGSHGGMRSAPTEEELRQQG